MEKTGCSNDYFSDTQVHQNNIRANLADILKTDYTLRRLLEKTGKTGRLANCNLTDAAAVLVEFYINNMTKLPAVLNINNLFFTKLTEQHKMMRSLFAFYIDWETAKPDFLKRPLCRIYKSTPGTLLLLMILYLLHNWVM